MSHAIGELTFDSPPGWKDTTILAFVAPSDDPTKTANVTVAREPRRGAETLKTHVHRYLVDLAATLPSFDMREMVDVDVAGRAAIRIRGEWVTTRGRFEQTSLHLVPDAMDTAVTTITVTSSIAASHVAGKALADLLASARFGHTAPPSLPVPPSWDRVDRVWR